MKYITNLTNNGLSNIYAELAKRNLKRHTVRTALAAIGIIIGVVTIASIGILGNSLKLSVTESLGDAGNELVVYPSDGGSTLTKNQIEKIDKIEGIEYIIPVLSNSEEAEYKGELISAPIYSIEKDDLHRLFEISEGRFLVSGYKDCIMGSKLADSFNLKIGGKTTIKGSEFRIVGILKEKGLDLSISPDQAIFITPEMYQNIYGDENGYNYLIIRVKTIDDVENVKKAVEERFNKKENVVNVLATNEMLKNIDNIFNSISLFLIGIGSISLLVAGVSILNVMLMSTMERIKEIGIMKAIGASRRDIMKTFILEAFLLGVVASFVGGVLSFAASLMVNILILKDASYLFTPSSISFIIVGVAFGITTSLLGGIYPAWKASKMQPLDALRYE